MVDVANLSAEVMAAAIGKKPDLEEFDPYAGLIPAHGRVQVPLEQKRHG
jgi:hypothetical protein